LSSDIFVLRLLTSLFRSFKFFALFSCLLYNEFECRPAGELFWFLSQLSRRSLIFNRLDDTRLLIIGWMLANDSQLITLTGDRKNFLSTTMPFKLFLLKLPPVSRLRSTRLAPTPLFLYIFTSSYSRSVSRKLSASELVELVAATPLILDLVPFSPDFLIQGDAEKTAWAGRRIVVVVVGCWVTCCDCGCCWWWTRFRGVNDPNELVIYLRVCCCGWWLWWLLLWWWVWWWWWWLCEWWWCAVPLLSVTNFRSPMLKLFFRLICAALFDDDDTAAAFPAATDDVCFGISLGANS